MRGVRKKKRTLAKCTCLLKYTYYLIEGVVRSRGGRILLYPPYRNTRRILSRARTHLGPGIFFPRRRGLFGAFPVITVPEMAPGPGNGLERHFSQFYTICDKNQLLNKNTGKVMAILVPGSWDVGCQVVRAENPVHVPAYWSCIWGLPADRDLKMSCIDAFRRQLQSALKIRVYLN
jgi:hypothetical protein